MVHRKPERFFAAVLTLSIIDPLEAISTSQYPVPLSNIINKTDIVVRARCVSSYEIINLTG